MAAQRAGSRGEDEKDQENGKRGERKRNLYQIRDSLVVELPVGKTVAASMQLRQISVGYGIHMCMCPCGIGPSEKYSRHTPHLTCSIAPPVRYAVRRPSMQWCATLSATVIDFAHTLSIRISISKANRLVAAAAAAAATEKLLPILKCARNNSFAKGDQAIATRKIVV